MPEVFKALFLAAYGSGITITLWKLVSRCFLRATYICRYLLRLLWHRRPCSHGLFFLLTCDAAVPASRLIGRLKSIYDHTSCFVTVSLLDRLRRCYWQQTDRMQDWPIILDRTSLLTASSECANHYKIGTTVHTCAHLTYKARIPSTCLSNRGPSVSSIPSTATQNCDRKDHTTFCFQDKQTLKRP